MRRILNDTGIAPKALEQFEEAYDQEVGEGKTFRAENIAGRTVMEIKSPSVKISVKSEMSSMITTKVIDGREYILIPVQDDIELNGIRLLTTRQERSEYEEDGSGGDGEILQDESLLNLSI